nr:probable choline kinase 3 [Tanacetum cinerariifolium]
MAVKINGFIEGTQSEGLMKLLLSLASNWGDSFDTSKLKVVHLSGAMTNVVYRITWPKNGSENDDRTVLVRVYGEGSDIFFDREEEIRTFESISSHGHGPSLLGQFAEGRVEEFIHAKTLSAGDLRDPEISALIAAKLREFHNLNMPGSKNALLWPRMRKWDYEYASYNPVAYDLANHFCEMAANYHTDTPHVLDYNLYPDLEERRRFVQAYLSSTGNEPSNEEVDCVTNIDFDYMEYARQRFRQYWLRKPQLLKGKTGISQISEEINDLVLE